MHASYVSQYRALYQQHWWWRAREKLVLEAIGRWHQPQPGDHVLDVGCGDGLLFSQLARFGAVEGVEADASAVSAANTSAGAIHVQPFDETFQSGRRYALITMLDVLEHLDDAPGALHHAARLLTPQGTLVVTVPALRWLWTRHDVLNEHRTRFSRATLLPLFAAANLRVLHARYLFPTLVAAKLAVRAKEALIPGEPRPPRLGPAWFNRLMLSAALIEERFTRTLRVSFGTSLLVIARRDGEDDVKADG
jgi:2-polyprenyl-3-methyl-5-hydroxy-6-metoxy-1,4-benzoquinol methylase